MDQLWPQCCGRGGSGTEGQAGQGNRESQDRPVCLDLTRAPGGGGCHRSAGKGWAPRTAWGELGVGREERKEHEGAGPVACGPQNLTHSGPRTLTKQAGKLLEENRRSRLWSWVGRCVPAGCRCAVHVSTLSVIRHQSSSRRVLPGA